MSNSLFDECCFEPKSRWSGRLLATPEKVAATLYAFEELPRHRDKDTRVELTLSSGYVATLMQCHIALSGSSSTWTKAVARDEINAKYLLAGIRAWGDDDLVSEIEFCLPGARSSLNYGEHRESEIEGEEDEPIVDVRRTHYSRLDIAKIELDGFEVSFSMRRSVLVPSKDELGSEVPWVNVKFNEPLSFEGAFQLPFQIRTFFEISVGRPVAMKGMGVRAFRELPLSSGDERLDHFELYVAEDSEVEPATSPTHGDPIFKFWRSEDRSITIKALEIWLSRRSAWASAYWLASQFIVGGVRIDRSHMMRAMAWFESIPDYISEKLVDERAVKALCREARNLDTFKCMGVPDSRLKEVLNELARATLISRIERAIADLNAVAGSELFTSAFLEDCKMAKKLRDKAAHGGDDVHEKDFRNVIRAATAIETLALLSTVRGLGLTREMMSSITNRFAPHPFAGYFLWAKEAQ